MKSIFGETALADKETARPGSFVLDLSLEGMKIACSSGSVLPIGF
jgi:hypothetical protein